VDRSSGAAGRGIEAGGTAQRDRAALILAVAGAGGKEAGRPARLS